MFVLETVQKATITIIKKIDGIHTFSIQSEIKALKTLVWHLLREPMKVMSPLKKIKKR